MAAVSQRPGRLDLDVVRGDDAEVVLTFVDADGDPVNLSGRTWQLRLGGAISVNLDDVVDDSDAVTGVISFPLADTTTQLVTDRTTWYLRDDTNDRTLLDGQVRAATPGQAGGVGSTSQTVTITNGTAEVTVTAAVVGPSGTAAGLVHNLLTGRDAEDAHPISAITGLQDALDALTGGGGSNLRVDVAVVDDTDSIDLGAAAPDNIPAVLIWGRATGNGVYEASVADGWTLLDPQPTLVVADALVQAPAYDPVLDTGVASIYDYSDTAGWQPVGSVPTLDGNPSQVWGPTGWVTPDGGGAEVANVSSVLSFDLDGVFAPDDPVAFPPGFILAVVNQNVNPEWDGIYEGQADPSPAPMVRIGGLPETLMWSSYRVTQPSEVVAPLPGGLWAEDDGVWFFVSGRTLADLTDVDVVSDPPAQDDVLAWDDTESKWTPATLDGGVALSDATPQALGTAASGVSDEASRADHVHDMPTAADIAVDASGFNGNLTTSDDTVQEIAQKLDDLSVSTGTGGFTRSLMLGGM